MTQLTLNFDAQPTSEPLGFIGPLLCNQAYDDRERINAALVRLERKWRAIRIQEQRLNT